ncbi:MAG: hemerythrin domain-containing protein [Chloroflexota bacterium]
MKATKILQGEQIIIEKFLAAFALGTTSAAQNRPVKSGFFIYAANFINGFIEGSYFKKEAALLKSLEENGLTAEHGPLAAMFNEIEQSRDLSRDILSAARQWQEGDADGRNDLIWAASTYTSVLRQHIDRARSMIFPLAEQLISIDDQYKIAEAFNHIVFEGSEVKPTEQYEKIIVELQNEADEWK